MVPVSLIPESDIAFEILACQPSDCHLECCVSVWNPRQSLVSFLAGERVLTVRNCPLTRDYVPFVVGPCVVCLAEGLGKGVESRREPVVILVPESFMIPIRRWIDYSTGVDLIPPQIITVVVCVASRGPIRLKEQGCIIDHFSADPEHLDFASERGMDS